MTMEGHLLQKLLPPQASLWFRFSIQAQEVQQYHKMPHPSEFGKDTTNKKIDMAITCSKNVNPLQKPQPPDSDTFGSHLAPKPIASASQDTTSMMIQDQ